MGFKEDLEKGGSIEQSLLKRLKTTFPRSERASGNHPEFDIQIPEIGKTIEVKYDPMSMQTGNVVVEYFHRKPSALSVSEADYWFFDLGDGEYWFTKEGILDCILSERMNPVCITGTTDRYSKWVFLIPRQIFVRYSISQRDKRSGASSDTP